MITAEQCTFLSVVHPNLLKHLLIDGLIENNTQDGLFKI
jgi:hypothetical protein